MIMYIYTPQHSSVCLLPTPGKSKSNSAKASLKAVNPYAHRSELPAYSTTQETSDETLSHLAAAAVRSQHYPQALRLLSELIDRHPQTAMHYSNRGLVHLRLGQTWAALADCDQAVDLGPNLDQAYNNRAMCYSALGDLAAALDDYDRAVDLNPFNIRARINLGATLRQMGAFDSALDCFDEALMFHQLPEFIYAERGRTYHLRGDWNCALADYQRALVTGAASPSTHSLKALKQRIQDWIAELVPQQSCG